MRQPYTRQVNGFDGPTITDDVGQKRLQFFEPGVTFLEAGVVAEVEDLADELEEFGERRQVLDEEFQGIFGFIVVVRKRGEVAVLEALAGRCQVLL